MKTRNFLLAVAVALAMAFMVSCSFPDDDVDGGSGDKGNDIKNYKTVVIGTQTWMAENLNYYVSGSKCYDDKSANCAKYGRMYDLATAKKVCPSGWHLPSNLDWDKLLSYVDSENGGSILNGYPMAGRHLKAKDGWWRDCGPSGSGSPYLCDDTYGFSALPGGGGCSGSHFDDAGDFGCWWSIDENDSNSSCVQRMIFDAESTGFMCYGGVWSISVSVRCVKD